MFVIELNGVRVKLFLMTQHVGIMLRVLSRTPKALPSHCPSGPTGRTGGPVFMFSSVLSWFFMVLLAMASLPLTDWLVRVISIQWLSSCILEQSKHNKRNQVDSQITLLVN